MRRLQFLSFLFAALTCLDIQLAGSEGIFTDDEDEKHSMYSRLIAKLASHQTGNSEGTGLLDVPFRSVGDYFLPDLSRAECGAWDSCVLRCGDPIKAPYMCSCDEDCRLYNDCCVDQSYYCGSGSGSASPSESIFTLSKLNGSSPERKQQRPESMEDYLPKEGSCHKWFGNKFYGIYYGDGEEVKTWGRKCMLELPPWCDPENSFSLLWGYQQSLSLLLNFGPKGWKNDLLFSSDYYDSNLCPNVWEIWDPFTQLCRPIECTDDYKLEDGKCVWDKDRGDTPSRAQLVGYQTRQANITFYGNILFKDTVAQFALESLRNDIMKTLSKKIRIQESRLTLLDVEKTDHQIKNPWIKSTTPKPPSGGWDPGCNATDGYKDFHNWILTEEGFPVTVQFSIDRKESNETNDLTIEQVLSVLHEAVAIRAVLQTGFLVPMKINAVNKSFETEEVEFFKEWCRGGDLESYWNEQFKVVFILKNKTEEEGPGMKMTMAIKIPETNMTYEEGTYVANLLYQSSDINAEAANVSGIIIVCENRPEIEDKSCTPLLLTESEYTLAPNGSLIPERELPGGKTLYDRSEYEFKPDSTDALVCIDYEDARNGGLLPHEYTFMETFASYLSMILLVASLLGLLLTIVTYGLFAELRTLPGWCLIHLCIGQFGFFLLFSLGAHQSVAEYPGFCTAVSIATHLCSLLFFSWSSVISYDLFATFTQFQPVTRSKEKYLWRYATFAYGLPIIIVFSSVMVEFHSSSLEIDYGGKVCWIGNPMAAMYVFAIPIAVSIVCNIVFFTLTIIGIRKVSKMGVATNLGQKERARFTLYLRMSSVQSFAWIFGFITVFCSFDATLMRIFEFLFISLSSLQGVYIFVAFVVNSRVKGLYADSWLCGKRGGRNAGFGFSVRSTILRGSEEEGGKSSTKRTNNNNNSAKNLPKSSTTGVGKKKKSLEEPEINNDKNNNDIVPGKKGQGTRPTTSGGRYIVAERTISNETCMSYVED